MNEFDIYMQLGNQLEQEEKMLMAYAAYATARQRAEAEQKELISNYLVMVAKKIGKTPQECNQELKIQLLQWINEGELAFAISCLTNIFEELSGKQWIDTENAILYRCLNIYRAEYNQGIIPWKIEGKNMEELKTWYYQLKFMVRRVDMNLSDDKELIEFIRRENVSAVALYEMIETICYFPQKVYGYLVKVLQKWCSRLSMTA